MIDDRLIDEAVERVVAPQYFEPCYFSIYRKGAYIGCRVIGAYRIPMVNYHKSNKYYVVCEHCIKNGAHRVEREEKLRDGINLGIPCSRTSARYYKHTELVRSQKRLEQEADRKIWPQCWE